MENKRFKPGIYKYVGAKGVVLSCVDVGDVLKYLGTYSHGQWNFVVIDGKEKGTVVSILYDDTVELIEETLDISSNSATIEQKEIRYEQ